MKTVSISGSPRANVGKKDAKALRRAGNVPCVLYGGKEQVAFYAQESAFKKLVYTPDVHIVNLDINGVKTDAIMQDIQFNPVTDRIAHIDFLQIVAGKAVTMNVPISCTGTAVGVREGGKLQVKMRTIKAKGLIEKMPEKISLDVSNMKIGDTVRVGDLKYDGISFLESENVTVVAVRVTRNVAEETPAATTAAAATPAAGATPAPAADAKKEEKKDEKKK